MPGTSSRLKRGAGSRRGRGLKVALAVLVGLAILLVLNVFALDNETGQAGVNVTGGQLVNTTSGQLQVVDTPPEPLITDGGAVPIPGVPPTAVPLAPPVVLIHGSGGAIDWWDELTPLLTAQGRRVIAIDMLGYGGSDKPASGYSIQSQAGLIAQVLSKLDVKRAAVVGHSLGGKVATALAEGSPDLVAGVAIIDTAPDSSYGGLSGGATVAKLPVIGPALWRLSPDFVVRRNLKQAFAPGFDVPEQFVDDVRAMTYPAYRDSASESDTYTDAEPLNTRLGKLDLPLLVIFGEQEQLYPARESLSAYAAIPGVETVLIPDAGHSPNVETPEKVAVVLGRFVNGLAPEPEIEPMPGGKPGNDKPGHDSGGKPGSGNQNGQQGKSGNGQKKSQPGQGKKGGGKNGNSNAGQGGGSGGSQPGA